MLAPVDSVCGLSVLYDTNGWVIETIRQLIKDMFGLSSCESGMKYQDDIIKVSITLPTAGRRPDSQNIQVACIGTWVVFSFVGDEG